MSCRSATLSPSAHTTCANNMAVVIQILLSVGIVLEVQLQSLSSISLLPFKAKLSICHIWVHKTLQKAIHVLSAAKTE